METGSNGADVWLVIGVQASGKSTVADLLARRFDRGVHVRGGQFYRWVARGWVAHDDEDLVAARRHLELRYRLSATCADEYAAAGFSVVVQDNIYGPDVVAWLRAIRARPRRLVVLRPSLEVVAQRDAARLAATGKVAYRPGSDSIASLDALLDGTPRLGLCLDTSTMSPDEVVDAVLDGRDRAIVDTQL